MIEVSGIQVFGWEVAITGMRNPMNSWDKSDSGICSDFSTEYRDGRIGCSHDCPKWSEDHYCGYSEHLEKFPYDYYMVGPNDLNLMKHLTVAGPEHRKFLRMIHVQIKAVIAPLYWWKEYDTYKVGTVANSCSTMHKIHSKLFEIGDFSHEKTSGFYPERLMMDTITELNILRAEYNRTKDKDVWYQMIQLLPSSYNQLRTVDFSYETAINMIHQRKNHKLDEWRKFVDILKELPYMKELLEAYSEEGI